MKSVVSAGIRSSFRENWWLFAALLFLNMLEAVFQARLRANPVSALQDRFRENLVTLSMLYVQADTCRIHLEIWIAFTLMVRRYFWGTLYVTASDAEQVVNALLMDRGHVACVWRCYGEPLHQSRLLGFVLRFVLLQRCSPVCGVKLSGTSAARLRLLAHRQMLQEIYGIRSFHILWTCSPLN